jgi:hypothetical protein
MFYRIAPVQEHTMSPIEIVNNEYITVNYLPDEQIVYHTIHQPFGGQPFRDAITTGTEALVQYGACKWLSDDRKNGPLSQEDAKWGFNVWNKNTIEAGWKYWAMVVPEKITAVSSLSLPIMELMYLGLHVCVFTKPDDAMDWLKRQGFEDN